MSIAAKGISKKLVAAKETTWGTAAGAGTGKYIRRVTSNFNLTKQTYSSQELRTDYQIGDFRHGVRQAEGSINGELSPGAYADFFGSVVARDFTTGASATALTVTIAASGLLFTVTRSAGSWITDGFKVGNIVRLTGAGLNTANQNNNLLVLSMSATVLTVKVLSITALVAEAAVASVTATVAGKTTQAPLVGHTDDSYTIEEFYSDISQSQLYTGNKVGSIAVQLPSTGLTTVDVSFMGKNLDRTDTTAYFTSPTAAPTSGLFAAVNGALVVDGVPVALITSADFTIERGLEAATVVGSNFAADVFTGTINVTGNMSVYYIDDTFLGYFDDETPVSVVMALTSDNTKNATAMAFTFPKVKFGSFSRQEAATNVVAQSSFQALLNDVTTAGLPATSIQIQDTSI